MVAVDAFFTRWFLGTSFGILRMSTLRCVTEVGVGLGLVCVTVQYV